LGAKLRYTPYLAAKMQDQFFNVSGIWWKGECQENWFDPRRLHKENVEMAETYKGRSIVVPVAEEITADAWVAGALIIPGFTGDEEPRAYSILGRGKKANEARANAIQRAKDLIDRRGL
jgi:hypothetical protein